MTSFERFLVEGFGAASFQKSMTTTSAYDFARG